MCFLWHVCRKAEKWIRILVKHKSHNPNLEAKIIQDLMRCPSHCGLQLQIIRIILLHLKTATNKLILELGVSQPLQIRPSWWLGFQWIYSNLPSAPKQIPELLPSYDVVKGKSRKDGQKALRIDLTNCEHSVESFFLTYGNGFFRAAHMHGGIQTQP